MTHQKARQSEEETITYHVLSMIQGTEVQSLVLAVNDDVHHGADLCVGDVVSALSPFPQKHLKAL